VRPIEADVRLLETLARELGAAVARRT